MWKRAKLSEPALREFISGRRLATTRARFSTGSPSFPPVVKHMTMSQRLFTSSAIRR
jgi:hypothetical protein